MASAEVLLPRLAVAIVLSLVTAVAVDVGARRRGRQPPGFELLERRLAAGLMLVAVFFIGVFSGLMVFDLAPLAEPEALTYGSLFFFQGLLLVAVFGWATLGFFGRGGWRIAGRQLGLRGRVLPELPVGVAAGTVAWLLTLLAAAAAGQAAGRLGGGDLIAAEPSEVIVWMAGLPVVVRVALSLSAGIVEEIFFRGLLQPRIGLVASTVVFVAGHAAYGQPVMLVGLTVLSLLYGGLAWWRGSVWAAIVAHILFDAVQLLAVIPAALEGAG